MNISIKESHNGKNVTLNISTSFRGLRRDVYKNMIIRFKRLDSVLQKLHRKGVEDKISAMRAKHYITVFKKTPISEEELKIATITKVLLLKRDKDEFLELIDGYFNVDKNDVNVYSEAYKTENKIVVHEMDIDNFSKALESDEDVSFRYRRVLPIIAALQGAYIHCLKKVFNI